MLQSKNAQKLLFTCSFFLGSVLLHRRIPEFVRNALSSVESLPALNMDPAESEAMRLQLHHNPVDFGHSFPGEKHENVMLILM